MDSSWTRRLKSAYRQEPLLSFAATAGAVNVAIGSLNAHWVLMSLGLGTVGIAIALRWWQVQRRKPNALVNHGSVNRTSIYALPPSDSPQTLPLLSIPKKNPPRQ